MQPKSIKKKSQSELIITWNDGHESVYTLRQLRDICPCAACQGESVLLREQPAQPASDHPRRYELVGIKPVGSYAVQIEWGDGHAAGIYSWEYLLDNCPCEICRRNRKRQNV